MGFYWLFFYWLIYFCAHILRTPLVINESLRMLINLVMYLAASLLSSLLFLSQLFTTLISLRIQWAILDHSQSMASLLLGRFAIKLSCLLLFPMYSSKRSLKEILGTTKKRRKKKSGFVFNLIYFWLFYFVFIFICFISIYAIFSYSLLKYRYIHTHIRAGAESVAFYHGQLREKQNVTKRFEDLIAVQYKIVNRSVPLNCEYKMLSLCMEKFSFYFCS